jgi:hypothetical protein
MALEAGLVEVRVGLVMPTFRDGEGKRVAWVTMEPTRVALFSFASRSKALTLMDSA